MTDSIKSQLKTLDPLIRKLTSSLIKEIEDLEDLESDQENWTEESGDPEPNGFDEELLSALQELASGLRNFIDAVDNMP